MWCKFALGVSIQGLSKTGQIEVEAIFSILDLTIQLHFHSFDSNVGTVIYKYVNTFISIGKQLNEKYECIRIQIKNNWLNIIKENLKQFSKTYRIKL